MYDDSVDAGLVPHPARPDARAAGSRIGVLVLVVGIGLTVLVA